MNNSKQEANLKTNKVDADECCFKPFNLSTFQPFNLSTRFLVLQPKQILEMHWSKFSWPERMSISTRR